MTAAGSPPAGRPSSPRDRAGTAEPPSPGHRPGGDVHAAEAMRRGHRERTLAVLGCLLGAGVVLVSGGATWVSARVSGPRGGADGGAVAAPLAVHWTGGALASTATALALVGLAAAVAIVATRRIGRLVIGVLTAAAGAGIAYVAGRIGWDPLPTLRETDQVRQLVPGGQARIDDVSQTIAPWLSFAGGLLLILVGALVVLRGRSWPAMSGRYQARDATPADAWDAIERGHDPT
ncbi:Trp biosynthesis protein [Frankia sp. B2]|uniref:Trp biosynthesis-associated membrane protein n=2 Tax=Frankiaceae TaxID=74712 RepID=UPI0009EB464C|nr:MULTISPECIES: Trp biosynthesis-associated membrane protein [Frankia]TFE33410.1 Trp biosynthesis protein [Frankia sp. B2]